MLRRFIQHHQRLALTRSAGKLLLTRPGTTLLASALSLFSLTNPVNAADSPSSALQAAPEMLLDDQLVARDITSFQDETLALNTGGRIRSRSDISSLDVVEVRSRADGSLKLAQPPRFTSQIGGRFASITPNSNIVFYTLDPDLQALANKLVDNASARHIAIAAFDPKNGRMLAIAGRSATIPNIEYQAVFPAASLFKVVTAAAAVEQAGIQPDSLVAFRGGTYTLNRYNYLPNPRADRRFMSVEEALGRSCNPVFGRLASRYLDGSILLSYARKFGFNHSDLGFEIPLEPSSAQIPTDDLFELSRTGAGFGNVRTSSITAALFMAGVANDGLLPRPHIIERIASADGVTLEKTQPEILHRMVEPTTAKTLLEMMKSTTTIGTSRREFMRGARPTLGELEVAAKTGTLSSSLGLNQLFIAAAPINNPQIAIAVMTADPNGTKPSRVGRLLLQDFFKIDPLPEVAQPRYRGRSGGSRGYKPKHYAKKPSKSSKSSTKKKSSSKKSSSRK
jgi:peptidoglycan glycosyltransferase